MIVPARVTEYLDDVGRLADVQVHPIVSVLVFGSAAVGGFSESSGVDLVVVLADGAPGAAIQAVGRELAALERRHGLREPEASVTWERSLCDRRLGGLKSVTVCRRRDLLSGDVAAVFGLSRLAALLFGSTYRFCLAAITTSARTVWGEDCAGDVPVPPITRRTLFENYLLHLVRNACTLVGYAALPNATRYSRSILEGFVHDCHFVCTSTFATIEEEVAFFRAKLGERTVLADLLAVRSEHRRSLVFTLRCFPALVRLHAVTSRENRLPGVTAAG